MDKQNQPKHRSGTGQTPHTNSQVNVNPKTVGVLERNWTTALLLSILLGLWGIDQFYLGKTGKGILKLLTFGLFGILWIIDIIMIATKSVRGIVWLEGESHGKSEDNWFRRHPVWTVVIGVFAFFMIVGALTGDQTNTTSSKKPAKAAASTESKPKPQPLPKIGQQADDGKLGFTITSFKCGVAEISQPDNTSYTSTTGAPYCLMNLSIKGISDVSQDFDSDSQYIYDSHGKQYSVDSDATITANKTSNNCMLSPTVNPNVTITCTLAFDVPSGASPTYSMLHDSAASDGVKVSLHN